MKRYHIRFRSIGFGTLFETVADARSPKAAVARAAHGLGFRARLPKVGPWTFTDHRPGGPATHLDLDSAVCLTR